LLAQVIWWSVVFLRDVGVIATLKGEKAQAMSSTHSPDEWAAVQSEIEGEAFHRRIMFLSESIFFVCLTCLAMYLLYHALHAEERSREIQRNFIEIISHESKTPLTALKLRLESLIEPPADSRTEAEVRLALDEVKRLVSLFDKVLTLNRTERQALRFEPLYLTDIVREVSRRLDPVLRARGVKFIVDIEPELAVAGDAHGLQNSLQSVLENAVQYNDRAEKEIRVTARQEMTRVILSISDNGPGIAVGDRQHVFERFYRGSRTRQIPGSGLGLYLAKTILEAHRGTIRLVNGSNSGAHFEIELPAGGTV